MPKLTTGQVAQELKRGEQPWLLVLVGVPGSGKSTFTRALREKHEFDVLSIDDALEALAKEHGVTYSEAHKRFFKEAKEHMRSTQSVALAQRRNVVWDQTNVSAKSRRSKLHDFIVAKYACYVLTFDCSEAELFKRLDQRATDTGKFVPRHVVIDMLKSYTPPTKAEGFSQVWEHA